MAKRVAILGSTGSIGTQALDVIARHPNRFTVAGLAAGKQVQKLREQVERFGVPVSATADDGPGGLLRVAVESEPDVVLAATDGFVAFDAIFAAVSRGTDIAVANKELIVSAGELLIAAASKSGSTIVPVDSEHSALFQCLIGEDRARVASLVLTASGGPFWRRPKAEIENATLEAALAHPTWRMGVKNTVDSATMMNKGLEVIEASRLFGMPGDRIAILVHPQSIAHGMVIFTDGNVKIQAAPPDMRLPIGYALAFPDRLDEGSEPLDSLAAARTSRSLVPRDDHGGTAKSEGHSEDRRTRNPEERGVDALAAIGGHPEAAALRYEFERPDLERFPCVRLAYQALAAGGTLPAVLSAANEIAVEAFVEGVIRFGQIPSVIEQTLSMCKREDVTLDSVRRADRAGRENARQIVAAAQSVKVGR